MTGNSQCDGAIVAVIGDHGAIATDETSVITDHGYNVGAQAVLASLWELLRKDGFCGAACGRALGESRPDRYG